MQELTLSKKLNDIRVNFLNWKNSASTIFMLILSICIACLTGFLAQIKIYFPWTPVPIVLSSMGPFIAGILLGRKWGVFSMLLYILLGVMGIPWFAGFHGGIPYLIGPTGGYLFGFILAALFTGHFIDSAQSTRKFFPLLGIMLVGNFLLIYIPGLIGLGLWINFSLEQSTTIWNLLWMGAIPFVLGDMIKSIIAVFIARSVIPKRK
ncbi:MAG: biotin transporter BioY [Promethearchaeota archaeon]